MKFIARAVVVVFLVVSGLALGPGSVAAQQTTVPEEPEVGENGVLDKLWESVTWVLFELVRVPAEVLTGILTRILASYPDVTNPEVLEIHQKMFQVSVALATAAVVWIGLLSMTGRIDGVRPLMYVLGSVAFGAVAPWLLQYPVELSRLTTEALVPTNPSPFAVNRLSTELFIVALLDVFLLLGTVMIFVARDVILMLGAALSPLLGLLAVTPGFRRATSMLVNAWIACLLIGPLNATVLDLILVLLESNGEIPHYIWAFGGLGVLFGLPLALLGAGTLMASPLLRFAGQASGVINQYVDDQRRNDGRDRDEPNRYEGRGSRNRENRFRRRG
ncbi:hypothetical protein [Halostella pelagica]|uniref:hypothetical protein n=1 Tax=Halostella pelagica TaxID=2583824 RepID=UPI001081978B|nr:hypothetical protein [Halostella pelagica]